MSNVPEITEEQRREALALAVESRRRMARVKAAVKRGRIPLRVALGMEAAQPIRALDMIASVPGCGRKGAAAVAERLGISPRRRVRGLGARQRAALAEWAEGMRGARRVDQ